MPEGRNDSVLVFDVGGSHVAASIFHLGDADITTIRRIPIQKDGGPEEFFDAFVSLAKGALPERILLRGIAVAMPNPFDYERGVSYMQHKFKQIYGMELRGPLSERLSCDPSRIHFLNDAAAFLIGENHRGAAVHVNRVVAIVLGTGVGSAFAMDGEVVLSGCGVPPEGEIWNLAYEGKTVEDFVSTVAIQQIFERLAGQKAEVREIAEATSRMPEARQTFDLFGSELGKILNLTCCAFAPERIVLGGGVSRAAAFFLPALKKELTDFPCELRVSELFERAPLIGAGFSWARKHEEMPRRGDQSHAKDDA
jgi:glucokinase